MYQAGHVPAPNQDHESFLIDFLHLICFFAAAELQSTTQMQRRELMARIDVVEQQLNKRQRLQATSDNMERTLRDENERLLRDNKDMRSELMVRVRARESDFPKSSELICVQCDCIRNTGCKNIKHWHS